MKAKTRNQKRVVAIDSKIKELSPSIITWAQDKLMDHYAIRYKSGIINCLKCGHKWHQDVLLYRSKLNEKYDAKTICPKCKFKLKVKYTQERTISDERMFTVVQRHYEYQVVRNFYISGRYKCGKAADYFISEAFRTYTREDGKQELIGCLGNGGWYGYRWSFHTMELRHPRAIQIKYGSEYIAYPRFYIQPWLKKRGFTKSLYLNSDYAVCYIAKALCSDPMMETLAKYENSKLFVWALKNPDDLEKYWPTVKMIMRHKYLMAINVQTYFDMIKALDYFGKDLTSPKYILPKNPMKAHDLWINKRNRREQQIREERMRKDRIELFKQERKERIKYEWRMRRFRKFELQVGDIKIKPFVKLEEVAWAGDVMHHCIFQSDYYWKHEANILFGAYLNGKLIETSQFHIKDKKVHHSYGKRNEPSYWHKTIVKTLNEKASLIVAQANKKSKSKVVL